MTILLQDFDAVGGQRALAALSNFLLSSVDGAGGVGGPDTSLKRVTRYFRAWVKVRPSLPGDMPWTDRAELELCMRLYGPDCTADDLENVITTTTLSLSETYAGVNIT